MRRIDGIYKKTYLKGNVVYLSKFIRIGELLDIPEPKFFMKERRRRGF